jgi:hypothetical protein
MRWKWVWLALGLVVGGGMFSYVGHRVAQTVEWRTPGRIVPAAVLPPAGGSSGPSSGGDRELAQALRMLLRRVDSLRTDSTGRRVYDSLVAARPGMLDSARVAERFYSLQALINK